MGSMEPCLKGCRFENTMRKRSTYTTLTLSYALQLIYNQYENAYFPVLYVDNQLLCSLCGPKWSHAFNFAIFKHNNSLAVGRPVFAISPQ